MKRQEYPIEAFGLMLVQYALDYNVWSRLKQNRRRQGRAALADDSCTNSIPALYSFIVQENRIITAIDRQCPCCLL